MPLLSNYSSFDCFSTKTTCSVETAVDNPDHRNLTTGARTNIGRRRHGEFVRDTIGVNPVFQQCEGHRLESWRKTKLGQESLIEIELGSASPIRLNHIAAQGQHGDLLERKSQDGHFPNKRSRCGVGKITTTVSNQIAGRSERNKIGDAETAATGAGIDPGQVCVTAGSSASAEFDAANIIKNAAATNGSTL